MSFFKDLNENLKVIDRSTLNEGKGENLDERKKKGKEQPKDDEVVINESVSLSICNECGSLLENAEGVCPECNEGVLEEAMKLVVRDGKVVKKNVARKKKLTSKQKAALAKARKKAHTGSANKARAKSMKVRNRRLKEAEEFECPECNYVGEMEEVETGVFVCPDCGVELETDASLDEKKNCSTKNESLETYKTILDIPSTVLNEGDDAVAQYLFNEFAIIVD